MRLRTPLAVQHYLNALPYNTEPPPGRATLRSFRKVLRHHTAHCLEADVPFANVPVSIYTGVVSGPRIVEMNRPDVLQPDCSFHFLN